MKKFESTVLHSAQHRTLFDEIKFALIEQGAIVEEFELDNDETVLIVDNIKIHVYILQSNTPNDYIHVEAVNDRYKNYNTCFSGETTIKRIADFILGHIIP